MKPTLYASNALYFERHGTGKLFDALSCIVHEEINGDFSMTFEYPITGAFYTDLLQEGQTVGVISPTVPRTRLSPYIDLEYFDVCKYSKPINGIVTFYCNHFSRRLTRSVCYQSSINTYWAANTGSSPRDYDGMNVYRITSTGEIPGTLVLTSPKSVLATLIGSEDSCVSAFGGEFKFSTDRGTGSFPNDTADLIMRYSQTGFGEDRGVYIRFGKNMLDVLHEKDKTGAFNAVVPFWSSGSGGTIKYVTGYTVQPTTPISPVIAVPLDLSSEFQNEPTEAQMVTAAQAYLDGNEPWKPTETITVDFASDVEIEEGAQISLGDTVHVYWEDADIIADLRVVSYDYDVLAERYTKLELGTQQTQFVAVTGDSYAGTAVGSGGGVVPAENITGVLPLDHGGTGASSAADARTNLGLGSLATVSNLNSKFSVEQYTVVSGGSVSANTYNSWTKAISKSGYYPLAIVGIDASGSGSTSIPLGRFFLSNVSTGSATINVLVRNVSSSAASPKITALVLWVSTS